MKKTLFISDEYPCFCKALSQIGYNIIPTKKISYFYPPEQRHADMQLLMIRDKAFWLSDCQDKTGMKYPENVRLNCLYLGNKLYANTNAADSSVLRFCRENDIGVVHVNQGYTRCSALVISDKAVITADKSLEKALKNNGAEVLLISHGHIRLEGFDYGFIGGSGFSDDGKTYFFGNIKKHPDFQSVKAFCEKYNSELEILCEDEPLTDIGGAVILSSYVENAPAD